MMSHNQGWAAWTLPNPEEHRALRAAVAGIAAKFGPRYYAERAAARRPCAELWQALGDAGFIGVNIPEEYGGGGGGLTELALVCEEIAAAGHAAAAAARVRRDLGRDDLRVRHRRAARDLAARPGQRRRQGGVRDHRAGRGLEHAAHLHHGAPGRRRLGAARHQVLHLRGRRGAGPAGGRADRAGRARRPAVPVHRPGRRPGPGQAPAPGRPAAARAAVHPALRRRAGRAGRAGRRGRGGVPAGFPRPESRTDHRSRPRRRHRALRPGRRGALRRPSARSGPSRSAPTRASRTRWPRPRSRPSSPR